MLSLGAYMVLIWVMVAIATATIAPCLWGRNRLMRQKTGAVEGLLLFAYLCYLAWSSVITELLLASQRPSTMHDAVLLDAIGFASTLAYYCALTAVKAFVLAVYFELAGEPHPRPKNLGLRYRVALISLSTYVAAIFLICFLITLLICYPVNRNWNESSHTCIARKLPFFGGISYALNISSDLLLIAYPCFVLRKVRNYLRPQEIIAVASTFCVATVAVTMVTIRFALLVHRNHPPKETWRPLAKWMSIELMCVLVGGCLVAGRGLLRYMETQCSCQSSCNCSTRDGFVGTCMCVTVESPRAKARARARAREKGKRRMEGAVRLEGAASQEFELEQQTPSTTAMSEGTNERSNEMVARPELAFMRTMTSAGMSVVTAEFHPGERVDRGPGSPGYLAEECDLSVDTLPELMAYIGASAVSVSGTPEIPV